MTDLLDVPFVRAFIALEVGEAVRAELAAVQDELRAAQAHVSWVAPENLHVSLAFLGDIEPVVVADLSGALDAVASPVAPFSFTVATVGTFGSSRSPRVLWAGVSDAGEARKLHSLVAEQATALGLALDGREFHPHVTLGRVRSSRGRDALGAALVGVRDRTFGETGASRVVLMRSVLGPSGARYTPLHAAVFRG